jgi:membrane-bound serine protease (ClpP class)
MVLITTMFSAMAGRAAANHQTVYVIPIKGEITQATAAFLKDGIAAANRAQAKGILIELSTLGGRVDSALDIEEAILSSKIPVAVYIVDRAISAGALIALSADTILMAPGSNIGDAEPIPNTEKNIAFIKSEFVRLANLRGRSPDIAAAMVDKLIEIPNLVRKGELLVLGAAQAEEIGYAAAISKTRDEALSYLKWDSAQIVEQRPDFKVRFAQFITRTEVASILITIGLIALIVEFFTQGFGLAGIVGIICFGLYFGGGILAGSTKWWGAIIFLVGIALILAEAFVPGFGVLGVCGIIGTVAGLILSAPDPAQGVLTVGIAFLLCLFILPVLLRYINKSKAFSKLILTESLGTDPKDKDDEVESRAGLTGAAGWAITPLRPSGRVEIDGQKIDVVSDGSYIAAGSPVKVMKVEGSRIVVTDVSSWESSGKESPGTLK